MMSEVKALQEQVNNPVTVNTHFSPATLNVVKANVFPNCTDEELSLFIYRCQCVGVHPLAGMLHPSVYNSNGGRRVVVVSSIDLFRSKAETSGQYDGQDEPEFEGVIDWEHKGKTIEVPELSKVRVYKKGISRPFVGVAYWNEFVPSENKAHMYAKMPKVMLAKCAEAQALRKAFPDVLNNVYAEEEMMQAVNESLGNEPASGKPVVSKTTAIGNNKPLPKGSPDDSLRKANRWISEAQEKRLYAILKNAGIEVDTFKRYIKEKYNYEHVYQVSWFQKQYERICKTIEEKPEYFRKWENKIEDAEVMSFDDVKAEILSLASAAGYAGEAELNKHLEDKFNCTYETITENEAPKILDYFINING